MLFTNNGKEKQGKYFLHVAYIDGISFELHGGGRVGTVG